MSNNPSRTTRGWSHCDSDQATPRRKQARRTTYLQRVSGLLELSAERDNLVFQRKWNLRGAGAESLLRVGEAGEVPAVEDGALVDDVLHLRADEGSGAMAYRRDELFSMEGLMRDEDCE